MQASQRIQFGFEMPTGARAGDLDPWLAAAGVEPQALAGSEPALQWAWRLLLLARTLLQAARLPVFDAPQIESVERNPASADAWRAAVRFPVIDLVPPACHAVALRGSARLCQWAARHRVDDAGLARFFEALDHVVLAKLKGQVPSGKGTVPVLRAAHEMGIPFMHLGGGIYQLGWGSAARRLSRSVTDADSALGARVAESKWGTAGILAMAGLPAPDNVLVQEWPEAAAAASRLGWPVVVKPADRERGEGVTVDVAGEAVLQSAFAHAKGLSPRGHVLVERQVPGVCHRLFIAQGRLLYAVKRLPMSLRGDGVHTVGELAQAALRADRRLPPWQRSGVVPLDGLAMASLEAAGWSESSIPPAGEWVPLRRIESTASGGVDEDVSGLVHPDNVDIAVRAAAAVGLAVAGIDLITTDIARPWHESGAVINEVNYSPLLGGGEISRMHLPEFLRRLMGPAMGRIPLEVFVADAPQAALARHRELTGAGLRSWYADARGVLGPSGEARPMAVASQAQRVRALLLDAAVDAVVVLMSPARFQADGLPVPGIATVHGAPAAAAGQRAPAPAA